VAHGGVDVNTVPLPLPAVCKTLDKTQIPAPTPLYKNTPPPKNFLKIFRKIRDEKKPRFLAGAEWVS